MKSSTRLVVWFVAAAILLGVPLMMGPAGQSVLGKMLIAGIFATGFGLLSGQSGMMSFGHAAFFGIGAIATMHAMIAAEKGGLHIPTPLLPVVGGLAGAILAAGAGAVAVRRSGSYFTLITLAIAELIHAIAIQWQSVFGGESGLTSMRMPWAGISFGSPLEVYYCILLWSVLCLLGAWLLTKTAFGQIILAIRENEERVRFIGFSPARYKVPMFAISGMFAGIAGGLLAFSTESATYSLFGIYVSVEVVFHTFIGGTALFLGPAVAAAALIWIPYVLSDWTRMWPLYQGVLFMVLMYYAPTGLSGLLANWRENKTLGFSLSLSLIARCVGVIVLVAGFIFAVETTHILIAKAADASFVSRWLPEISPQGQVFIAWAVAGCIAAVGALLFRRAGQNGLVLRGSEAK